MKVAVGAIAGEAVELPGRCQVSSWLARLVAGIVIGQEGEVRLAKGVEVGVICVGLGFEVLERGDESCSAGTVDVEQKCWMGGRRRKMRQGDQ